MVADKKMPQFKTSALKEDSGIVNVPMLAAEVPIHVTQMSWALPHHVTSRHAMHGSTSQHYHDHVFLRWYVHDV